MCMVPRTMFMDPLAFLETQPTSMQDYTKYFHGFINTNFVQGSICINRDSTTLWHVFITYQMIFPVPPTLFKVSAHGVVCIVHGSIYFVHGSIKILYCSIKIVHGSIYIIHGLTPKILIYHEFGLRFLAFSHHLATITHCSSTDAHSSINRAHVSTINNDIKINIELI